MSKTYILEPTEATVADTGHGEYSLAVGVDFGSELYANRDKPLFVSINDSVAPIEYNSTSYYFSATVNGWKIDSIGDGTSFITPEDGVVVTPGTYTVSVYTETEDPVDPYPVKNFTYEHAEVAKNDIEEIIQAIYVRLGETESQTAHGYSPADRLVIAVAKWYGVDPETALTTGNYPNQMKRIAAIIRGDFNTEEGASF